MSSREDRYADALAEQQDDAAWADHDLHRDCGTPVDGTCVVCLSFPEQEEA